MQRVIILLLLFSGFLVSDCYSRTTASLTVIQEVYDYLGFYPDNVVYPEEGSIKFKAWIVSRPEYVITDDHPGSRAGMEDGMFLIRFNLGSFPSLTGAPVDWQPGERVRIEVTHTATGRIAETEFDLDKGSPVIIRKNEEAISLINQPGRPERSFHEEAD